MERTEKDHGNRILRCHPDGTMEVCSETSGHLPAPVSRELQEIESQQYQNEAQALSSTSSISSAPQDAQLQNDTYDDESGIELFAGYGESESGHEGRYEGIDDSALNSEIDDGRLDD